MILSGRKVVTTAGTAVVLVANTYNAKKITIQALPTNSDFVAVGRQSQVVAAVGTESGILLVAGQMITFTSENTNEIYIDSVVSGEGVTYLIEF